MTSEETVMSNVCGIIAASNNFKVIFLTPLMGRGGRVVSRNNYATLSIVTVLAIVGFLTACHVLSGIHDVCHSDLIGLIEFHFI